MLKNVTAWAPPRRTRVFVLNRVMGSVGQKPVKNIKRTSSFILANINKLIISGKWVCSNDFIDVFERPGTKPTPRIFDTSCRSFFFLTFRANHDLRSISQRIVKSIWSARLSGIEDQLQVNISSPPVCFLLTAWKRQSSFRKEIFQMEKNETFRQMRDVVGTMCS